MPLRPCSCRQKPPIRAVLPSPDSATLEPNRARPVSPLPVSFVPCCFQVEPERVNTHAAPTSPTSSAPPIRAVLPLADSATLRPNRPLPVSPLPVSFVPCLFPGGARTREHPCRPEPALLSPGPPIRAVLPSPDSATLEPKTCSA